MIPDADAHSHETSGSISVLGRVGTFDPTVIVIPQAIYPDRWWPAAKGHHGHQWGSAGEFVIHPVQAQSRTCDSLISDHIPVISSFPTSLNTPSGYIC